MRVSSLTTDVILLASLFSTTIANPVPQVARPPTSVEKRAVVSNPTITLPAPTTTDPAIDLGVLKCQKNCKGNYHNCLASQLGCTAPSGEFN